MRNQVLLPLAVTIALAGQAQAQGQRGVGVNTPPIISREANIRFTPGGFVPPNGNAVPFQNGAGFINPNAGFGGQVGVGQFDPRFTPGGFVPPNGNAIPFQNGGGFVNPNAGFVDPNTGFVNPNAGFVDQFGFGNGNLGGFANAGPGFGVGFDQFGNPIQVAPGAFQNGPIVQPGFGNGFFVPGGGFWYPGATVTNMGPAYLENGPRLAPRVGMTAFHRPMAFVPKPATGRRSQQARVRPTTTSQDDAGITRLNPVNPDEIRVAQRASAMMNNRPLVQGVVLEVGATGVQVRYEVDGERRTNRFPISQVLFFNNGDLASADTQPGRIGRGDRVLVPLPSNRQASVGSPRTAAAAMPRVRVVSRTIAPAHRMTPRFASNRLFQMSVPTMRARRF